ncbi:MAG: hypothetical protein JST00_44625 [Deltaproteobacteria bacterium]|nr:hypothetical protein [Deltaproteobacteria bacterium]
MSVLHAALASATLFSASSGAENWEDRKGFVTEWSSGPSFGLVSRKQSSTEHLGYSVGFGAHFMRSVSRTPSHEKSGDIFGESDAVRWCMPFACMALGLLFSPPGALLGNELGFDVDATVANDMARIGVRPLLRYSKGALRSPSLVGQYTPWLAFTHADTADGPKNFVVVGWSLLPVDWRIGNALAIGFDPLRAGLMVDVGRGPNRAEISSSVVLRYAP